MRVVILEQLVCQTSVGRCRKSVDETAVVMKEKFPVNHFFKPRQAFKEKPACIA